MKINIMGDYVKITSIKLKTSDKGEGITFKKINDEKLKNNLVRARTNITELALSNDFKYFFTLTFKTTYDRYNLDKLRNQFKYIVSLIRKDCNCNLIYLIVPEQHKSGAWHFHGFFNGDIEKDLYINENGYLSSRHLDSLGYQNFQVIQNKVRISNYVTKYISKQLGKNIKANCHTYFHSLGLKKSECVDDFIYDNEFFNIKFFDWSNDYCYQKIISLEEYEKIKLSLKILKKI